MATRGRKRSPEIDAAIRAAAAEVLGEVGYASLTMEAVAARAGVSKATLYLRYPSRAVLVFDAIFGKTKVRDVPDHGDIRAELRETYRWAVDEFSASEARAAIPGLLAEVGSAPELARLVRTVAVEPEYGRVRSMLERARTRGEIRTDADIDLMIDVFIGTALARVTLIDHPLDHDFGDRLVDLILDGAR
ncbi:TetR/AcrR family transcriptional regulator [Tsukamurella soli]|uniref:TetR/AcrR family transcriptional regulator n=1 Tax=Tsukamurella soli TaxID=644556 RepID=A0ABP8J6G0_9ACTN